ncbi:MAG: YceI family protein [Bacteroidales bacterium]|nr:YceI family protein [Bacteroidales bacterium]MDD4602763.1 YceI family protein [Bacteroidales bacterium]
MENKTTWVIDPTHSEIQFKVKHLVISTVTGGFDVFEGAVSTNGNDFSNAGIEFTADVNSINTNQVDRDNHLKSVDFFDVANHPKLTFRSTGFKKTGDSAFLMTGNLTIRGTTKAVNIQVDFGGIAVDPYGNTKAGFELSGKINRKDFGLAWSALTETGGLVVADEIKLQMNVELIRQ